MVHVRNALRRVDSQVEGGYRRHHYLVLKTMKGLHGGARLQKESAEWNHRYAEPRTKGPRNTCIRPEEREVIKQPTSHVRSRVDMKG